MHNDEVAELVCMMSAAKYEEGMNGVEKGSGVIEGHVGRGGAEMVKGSRKWRWKKGVEKEKGEVRGLCAKGMGIKGVVRREGGGREAVGVAKKKMVWCAVVYKVASWRQEMMPGY